MKIKISRKQWQEMGKKAGWMKSAGGYGRFSEDLSDSIEGLTLSNRGKSSLEIAQMAMSDTGLLYMMQDEQMSRDELVEVIEGAKLLYDL